MDAAQHDHVGRRVGVGRGIRPAEGPGEAEHADDPPGQGDETVQRRHRPGHRRGGARRQDLGDGRQRHAVALAAAGADEVIDARIGRGRRGTAPGEGGGALGAQVPLRPRTAALCTRACAHQDLLLPAPPSAARAAAALAAISPAEAPSPSGSAVSGPRA